MWSLNGSIRTPCSTFVSASLGLLPLIVRIGCLPHMRSANKWCRSSLRISVDLSSVSVCVFVCICVWRLASCGREATSNHCKQATSLSSLAWSKAEFTITAVTKFISDTLSLQIQCVNSQVFVPCPMAKKIPEKGGTKASIPSNPILPQCFFTHRLFPHILFTHILFTQTLFTQKLFLHILLTHILFT